MTGPTGPAGPVWRLRDGSPAPRRTAGLRTGATRYLETATGEPIGYARLVRRPDGTRAWRAMRYLGLALVGDYPTLAAARRALLRSRDRAARALAATPGLRPWDLRP